MLESLADAATRARKLARLAHVFGRAIDYRVLGYRVLGHRMLGRLRGDWRGAVVQIENTNYCNFRCAYCVTHSPGSLLRVDRGHMNLDTYRAILDRHPGVHLVVIQGDGEPFMDPTVFDKIAIARARGALTQIITNGSLLAGATLDRVLADGPDLLLVSLDAVSPERNMAQRKNLRYDRVTRGIRELASRRRRAMAIGLLSVVHGPFTAETEAALRSFNDLGIDVLFYKQLNAAFENRIRGYRAPPINAIPRRVLRALNYPVRHQRIARIAPCPQLRFGLPYYLWDGRSTPCCVLNDPQYAADDYRRDVLLARWRRGDLPGECERCSYFAGYPAGARAGEVAP